MVIRDLQGHFRRRRWRVEVVGNGPGLRVESAVTRWLGARRDASRCAGGRGWSATSRPTVRLATSMGAPFPKVHAVPFHYSNPVSGKVPAAAASLSKSATQCERRGIELMRFPRALIEDASTGVALGLVSGTSSQDV